MSKGALDRFVYIHGHVLSDKSSLSSKWYRRISTKSGSIILLILPILCSLPIAICNLLQAHMAVANNKLYVNGYDELKNTLKKLGKDKRIFVFFYGSKDNQGHSWCPYCVEVEKPVEKTVEYLLPSNGIFIGCSVGDRSSWKDSNCSFRKDPQLRLTNIPTLVEWGTSKRLTENQLLDSDMIKILFEED
ncbi:unnamed protein product [Rotaria sp. Silwood1]|nr:unnamed protein product [Rotaria sp. Silwood1]